MELSLKRGPYYKLSISYIRKLTSLYKPSIFNDAYEHLQSLLAQKRTERNDGWFIYIQYLTATDKIKNSVKYFVFL